MSLEIPSHHRALILESVQKDLSGVHIRTLPTPIATSGSAVVQILASGVLGYTRDLYDGTRDYALPVPLGGGWSAIGRVVAVGSDALVLKTGSLVYVDCIIRGRDDPDATIMSGVSDGFTETSPKLMKDVWRNGTFAEFATFPLESCIPLNEDVLCQDLGYSFEELTYIGYLLVGYGGLRDIRLEPGETVIVCPATGGFGGAAVQAAVAMGARVIAMGRNKEELARLQAHVRDGVPKARIETVEITGKEEEDLAALREFGTIDAVLDLSPAAANKSTHLNSAILALRRKGRVSLMGGFSDEPIPSFQIIAKDLTIKGKFMYERDDIIQLVRMLEGGMFPMKKNFVNIRSFTLEDWRAAVNEASSYSGIGRYVVINP